MQSIERDNQIELIAKRNRLRAFWQKEDNAVVGKLIKDILDYSENTGAEAEVCRLIVARLLEGREASHSHAHENERPDQARLSQELRELQGQFFSLAADTDRSRAGLALEKLLNRLFEVFALPPRQPFR